MSLLPVLGCQKKAINFNQELPPGQLALRKISPAEYPDFATNDTDAATLARAIDNSLVYLNAPSSRQYFPYLDITHDRAIATLRAMKEDLVRSSSGAAFNDAIRTRYEVYKSIGAPNPEGPGYTDKVLFTGYYTPIYEASLTPTGAFQYPLYKRPSDLLSDPEGLTASRLAPDGRYVLYFTRGEIEKNNILAGQELVWLKSRWEAYVISVQGSGILRLTDGRKLEVGYAGNNGFPYTSPGRKMVADGVIAPEQLSLRGMSAFFTSNPQMMDQYLPVNQRFVFFTERPGGPFGSLNVPVSPFASIATDHTVYPRALPSFLTVPIPTSEAGATRDFRGFMMDQDTGGAIRASGRTDIYMGIGDGAERIAGHQLHQGELYYIALRPDLVPQYMNVSSPQMITASSSLP